MRGQVNCSLNGTS